MRTEFWGSGEQSRLEIQTGGRTGFSGWLKTTEIYCLLVWRLQVQNEGVVGAMCPLKVLGKTNKILSLFLPGFWWLLASGGCWLTGVPSISASSHTWPSSFCTRLHLFV